MADLIVILACIVSHFRDFVNPRRHKKYWHTSQKHRNTIKQYNSIVIWYETNEYHAFFFV